MNWAGRQHPDRHGVHPDHLIFGIQHDHRKVLLVRSFEISGGNFENIARSFNAVNH